MRILRVAQKVYPDFTGGASYHVHSLSRDQAALGHDVIVLTVRQDSDLPHIERRDGYTIIRFEGAVAPLGNDIAPGLVQFLCGLKDVDVVHAHSHLYFSTNIAALCRRFGDVPLAITNHGLYSQTAPEWVFDLYLRTLGKWTFDQADVVFCYTEADKRRVRNFGVGSRIEVVSNGIDTEQFSPEGPESDSIESDGPVVLFVGRLVEGKRPEIAVEAFAIVQEVYPDAELYLCGTGPQRNDLEELGVELGVRRYMTFLGHVSHDEMPEVYRCGDALILPSRAEGVPRTVMEALASGVPVVASDLEQVQDAFGEMLVYARDSDGFGRKICEVLNEDREVGLAERFRWEQTVSETTQILERISGPRTDGEMGEGLDH